MCIFLLPLYDKESLYILHNPVPYHEAQIISNWIHEHDNDFSILCNMGQSFN